MSRSQIEYHYYSCATQYESAHCASDNRFWLTVSQMCVKESFGPVQSDLWRIIQVANRFIKRTSNTLNITLRKKGTKAVTGAVPFQKVHFVLQWYILVPKLYILPLKMYILGPKMYILTPKMYILGPKMY